MMDVFEVKCNDVSGSLHYIHVVANDAGDAMILFRQTYDLDEFKVESIRQIIEPCVIEQ